MENSENTNRLFPIWLKKGVYERIVSWYKDKVLDLLKSINEKDMRSILIYFFSDIAKKVNEMVLKQKYEQDRFCQPSHVNQKKLHEIESHIYSLIQGWFDGIELSPVNPLWLNNFLTNLDPKLVLPTIRMNEILADATTVMALESSKRREESIKKWRKDEVIKLCTAHRFLRTQVFDEKLKFLPHFKMFAFCTAGRKNNWFELEKDALQQHLKIYIDILNSLEDKWYHTEDITFNISDIRIVESLTKTWKLDRWELTKNTTNTDNVLLRKIWWDLDDKIDIERLETLELWELQEYIDWLKTIENEVISELRDMYPNINFVYDLWRIAWMGYYDSYCFKVTARNKDWITLPLVDGWFSDRTRKITRNQKEIFLSSWLWLELLIENFEV